MVIGALHTVAVTLSLVIGGGTPAPYYLLIAVIEISCTSLIIWYAWRWKPDAALAAGS